MQTIEIGTAKEGEGAPRRSARYPGKYRMSIDIK
jgi:hypothetical protein